MTDLQFDKQGNLRHLLTLEGIDSDTIKHILNKANQYRITRNLFSEQKNLANKSFLIKKYAYKINTSKKFQNHTLVSLFFEASTRTRISFERAARLLDANVYPFDEANSSTTKGESVLDTFLTLQAMNIDLFVVRHKKTGIPEMLAGKAKENVHVINAGESNVSHPTQGLLDVFTIYQHKNDFKNLTVTIIGDIKHSRVARSTTQALKTLGTKDIRLAGPKDLMPKKNEFSGEVVESVDEAIKGADVVIMLRIQKERMRTNKIPNTQTYFKKYGLTAKRLKLAKPNAIVMHPGPINREVEIATEVADSDQSVITEQVQNGVAVRMAVISTLVEN